MLLGLNRDKKIIFYAAAILAVAAVVFFAARYFFWGGDKLAAYSNPPFHVTLEYPDSWGVNPEGGAFQGVPLYFGGYDGYFGIDAIAGDEGVSVDDIVGVFATNNPKSPYGSSPVISDGTVDGMEARFIFPSEDQPEEAKEEAAVVVRYPAPITIGDASYLFFMLYADKHHLKSIAETVIFINKQNEGPDFLPSELPQVVEESGKCFVGGCSGQVCSGEEDVITTCEFREEYACYKTAACERQPSGECGWTETPELKSCLDNARVGE